MGKGQAKAVVDHIICLQALDRLQVCRCNLDRRRRLILVNLCHVLIRQRKRQGSSRFNRCQITVLIHFKEAFLFLARNRALYGVQIHTARRIVGQLCPAELVGEQIRILPIIHDIDFTAVAVLGNVIVHVGVTAV